MIQYKWSVWFIAHVFKGRHMHLKVGNGLIVMEQQHIYYYKGVKGIKQFFVVAQ